MGDKETGTSIVPVQSTSTPLAVEGNTDVCRICFGSESSEANRLVRPCLCSGSVAFLHEACLRLWVESRGQAEPTCEICHALLKIETTTVQAWSLCVFFRSSTCLILPLSIPMFVVLVVIITSVMEDLNNSLNLGIFIGCICGFGLMVIVASVLIIRACRTKRILGWKVLPQHSQDSLSYVVAQP